VRFKLKDTGGSKPRNDGREIVEAVEVIESVERVEAV
jgi:hypothetical protein